MGSVIHNSQQFTGLGFEAPYEVTTLASPRAKGHLGLSEASHA